MSGRSGMERNVGRMAAILTENKKAGPCDQGMGMTRSNTAGSGWDDFGIQEGPAASFPG